MPIEHATTPKRTGTGMPTRAGSGMPSQVITTDRPCIRCKYNLIGLEVGGACPECGTAIVNEKKSVRFAGNLVDAPLGYIRLIAAGLALQAVFVLIVGFLMVFRGVGPVWGILATVAAVGWAGSAWIVTVVRPKSERIVHDEILDSPKIRLIARVSQSVGVLAVLAGWGAGATGSGILAGLAGILALGALFGLVPMGVYLSSLADWAGETGVGARLRAGVWCIAVCGAVVIGLWLTLQLPVPFKLLLAMGITICGLFVLVGLVLFGVSVLQLARAALWAINNAVQAREREIRIAEKKRRRAMRDAARAAAAEAAMAANAPPEPDSFADDPMVIPLDVDGPGGLGHSGARRDGQQGGQHDGRPSGKGPGITESRRERMSDPEDDSTIYDLAPEDD